MCHTNSSVDGQFILYWKCVAVAHGIILSVKYLTGLPDFSGTRKQEHDKKKFVLNSYLNRTFSDKLTKLSLALVCGIVGSLVFCIILCFEF